MDDVGVVLFGGTEAVEKYQGFAGAVAAQSGDVDARPTDSEGQGEGLQFPEWCHRGIPVRSGPTPGGVRLR